MSREKLDRTRQLMDEHALDALVTNYEELIPDLHLPDPKDRHVVAASIRGRADLIITRNLKDFPAQILAPLGLEAQHPDEFVLNLIDLAPGLVLEAVQNHRTSLKRPPKTIDEYLGTLEREGLTQTASALRDYIF